MGAIGGDVNSPAVHCINATDLASRPIASMKSGDRAYVEDRVGKAEGPRFFLDRESTLTVDNVGVLATFGGVGRWLSEELYGTGAEEPVDITLLPIESLISEILCELKKLRFYVALMTDGNPGDGDLQ